jgi:predicted flavoprotein YhiN
MVTRRGLEGGAVYALSGDLRDLLARDGEAGIAIDLRPDVPKETLAHKLAWPRGKQSRSNFIRKAAGLSPLAIALMRESGPLPETPEGLAELIKALPLRVTGVAGLERAISTAGGVIWEALDEKLMAKTFPGLFVAGEMLDWEAPTGGYLLTACFATGRAAGKAAADFAARGES